MEGSLLPWVLGDVDLGDDVLEVGPGPGLMTDALRRRLPRITSLEIDPQLARALESRLRGTKVAVVQGDATEMPFEDGRFSGAVCCTMLHHVPSAELQDRLMREVARVLRPGAILVGSDTRPGAVFRIVHVADRLVGVEPATIAGRLERAGFGDVLVNTSPRTFRFQGTRLA